MTSELAAAAYRSSMVSRFERPHPLDVVISAALAISGVGEILVPFGSRQGSGSAPVDVAVVVVVAAVLLVRRTHPLAPVLAFGLCWGVAAVTAGMFILFYGQAVPLAVAVFSVARWASPGPRLVGTVAAALCLLGVDVFTPGEREPAELVFLWGVMLLVWLAGFGLRRYEARTVAATRRAVEAEVSAATAAMQAVVDERTRIARELHDIVAHAVSSMVVQAGAAEQVALDDPRAAQQALESIRAYGADALVEMRRLVGILRDDGDSPSLSPQPGLGSLGDLVQDASAAGLSVRLTVTGRERPLPAGLDLSVYRIVQEALSNVRRHAHASRVEVSLAYADDRVSVEVVDDGLGPAGSGDPGHGLIGMRERAALFGGRVDAGSPDGHGFTVRADFPVVA